MANALDYTEVCQTVTQFVAFRSFNLLETAAEQVMSMLQQHFALTHLTLTVTKPFAVNNASVIQVTVER